MFSISGSAKVVYPLLNIYNSVEKETSKMDLIETDEGKASSLRQELIGDPSKVKTFDLNKLPKGIVLQEKKGYKIVTLKGSNMDYERGGELKIEFLVNAVTSKKKGKEFKIQKDPDGWKMYHNGQAIKVMKFIGNKVPFVGLVGVKEISMQYEGEKEFQSGVFEDDIHPRDLKEISEEEVDDER